MERARHGHDELTERQKQVLRLIERGHTNSEIAETLGISLQGAKWHVRELLGKFGADSREELIERSAAERGLGARVTRWMSGMAGIGLPKLSFATGAAGATVLAGAGLAIGVLSLGGGESEPAAAAAPTATPPTAAALAFVPAVAPLTPAPMPLAPGAIWTPAEAVDHARRSAGPELSSYEYNLAQAIDLDEFTVTLVEWLPGITTFELPGGDLYWENEGNLVRDIWHVRWQKNAVATSRNLQSQAAFVDLTVDFLIEDGKTVYGMQGLRLDSVATGSAARIGRYAYDGFRSRATDEQIRLMSTPTGPETIVAWLNNVPDTESYAIFPTALGHWCQKPSTWGGYTCGFDPGRPSMPVNYGSSRMFNPATGEAKSRMTVETQANVVSIRVITADGAVYDFETQPPPAGIPQETRYAFLNVGPIGSEPPVVIGFDAAGNEVARRDGPGMPPPPGANGP